jgi:hypothetical protein
MTKRNDGNADVSKLQYSGDPIDNARTPSGVAGKKIRMNAYTTFPAAVWRAHDD